MPSPQARYYLLTIPFAAGYEPAIRDELVYLKGQQEIGEGGYHHWQILAVFKKKVTLTRAKTFFPN
jgi:predicted secreted protein